MKEVHVQQIRWADNPHYSFSADILGRMKQSKKFYNRKMNREVFISHYSTKKVERECNMLVASKLFHWATKYDPESCLKFSFVIRQMKNWRGKERKREKILFEAI